MVHYFTWLRDLDTKKIGADVFGKLRNVVLEEKMKWSDEVTNAILV